MLLVLLLAPLLALIGAVIYGAGLCIPVMIALHFLHGFVPIIPALGWQGSFWLTATLYLLIPTSTGDLSD